jgi:hypothetical protein
MLCFGVRCSRPSEPSLRHRRHKRAFGAPNASWKHWISACCRTSALAVPKSAARCATDAAASPNTLAIVVDAPPRAVRGWPERIADQQGRSACACRELRRKKAGSSPADEPPVHIAQLPPTRMGEQRAMASFYSADSAKTRRQKTMTPLKAEPQQRAPGWIARCRLTFSHMHGVRDLRQPALHNAADRR